MRVEKVHEMVVYYEFMKYEGDWIPMVC